MNKAGKHIQSGNSVLVTSGKILTTPPSSMITNTAIQQQQLLQRQNKLKTSPLLTTTTTTATTTPAMCSTNNPVTQQKNVINSIMSFLPDNRPITSLQIVEDYERCPKNFTTVHRTYDQDADADLWRENNILFGRQTTRYLCLSKTEGLPDYVVETLKVIAEKVQPPKEFSLLSRTADTEQKAWRKRQIAYKLSKRGNVTQAVTDIILCSKLKIAPEGFILAGDINGVLVCYKTKTLNQPVRLPPPVPGTINSPLTQQQQQQSLNNSCSEVEKALNRLNLNGKPLPPVPSQLEHDYEEIIQTSYNQINSPQRPAPPLPSTASTAQQTNSPQQSQSSPGGRVLHTCHSVGTLGSYTELEGVPFVLNPALQKLTQETLPIMPSQLTTEIFRQLDYDFQLERQILCTMKSSASKNPFFN